MDASTIGGDCSASQASVLQRLVRDVRVVAFVNRPRQKGEFDAHVAEAVKMAPAVRAVLVAELEPARPCLHPGGR